MQEKATLNKPKLKQRKELQKNKESKQKNTQKTKSQNKQNKRLYIFEQDQVIIQKQTHKNINEQIKWAGSKRPSCWQSPEKKGCVLPLDGQ